MDIFLHGLESSSRGTKSCYFHDRFPDIIIPDFQGSLEQRMQDLRQHLKGSSDIRIIGSSFGGLMAAIYAMENEDCVKEIILLAPALHILNQVL